MLDVRMAVIDPMKQVRIRPVLDSTIILAALAPGIALDFWVRRSLPDTLPTPGTDPDVGRFDELALGRFDPRAAIASDVTAGLSVGLPILYHVIEAATRPVAPGNRRGRTFAIAAGTDAVLFAQALSINALVTQILKVAMRRPRPFTYLECADVPADQCQELHDAQESPNANWSFPSGHTSRAFAASTAGATLLTLELVQRSRWGIAAAWIGGLGLATTTAALRVLAGQHFGSDVLTSAVLGAGIGATVPLAHLQVARSKGEASRRSGVSALSVGPMGGRSVAGISLQGFLR